MNNTFYKSIHELDNKNTKFKSLFNLPGFNYKEKPIKIVDDLNINNHFVYNDKIIDEKIFVNFFGTIDNSNTKKKYNNKFTKKNKYKKNETKKMKPKNYNLKKRFKFFNLKL